MRRLIPFAATLAAILTLAPAAAARVLLVGTYHGIPGQFATIQAAVDAAKPNDWILIGPGDYKTTSVRAPKGAPPVPAGRARRPTRATPAPRASLSARARSSATRPWIT